MSAGSSGEVVITKSELAASISMEASKSVASGSIVFKSDSDSLPWLKVFSDSFEGMTVRSISFRYVNACASTQAGLFSMGWDPDNKAPATTRAKIAGYQPNCGGPVWGGCEILIPMRQPTKQFYSTATDSVNQGPGTLAWAAESAGGTSGIVLGEIWVTYTVTLFGPKA